MLTAVLNFEVDGEKFQKVCEWIKDSHKADPFREGKDVFWIPKSQTEEATIFFCSDETRKKILDFAGKNNIAPSNVIWYNVESWIAVKKLL